MPGERDACFIQFHIVFNPWHHEKEHAHLHHVAYFCPPPFSTHTIISPPTQSSQASSHSFLVLWTVRKRKYSTSLLQSWWGLGFLQKSNNRLFCYKTRSSRTLTERTPSFLPGSTNLVSGFFWVLGVWFVWAEYELEYLALKLKRPLFRIHRKQISSYRSIDLITKRF